MTTERFEETDTDDTEDEDDFSAEDIALGEAMDTADASETAVSNDDESSSAGEEDEVDEGLQSATAVLAFGDDAEAVATERAAFSAQVDAILSRDPNAPSEAPEQNVYADAAVKVAAMDPGEFEKFRQTLADANSKLIRDAAIKRGELNADGEPVEPPAPAFSPMGLDSATFALFSKAVQRDGAVDPREIPTGNDPDGKPWNYDSWVRAVDSAMGRSEGVER